MQKQPQFYAGIDVGTTAVRCIIGAQEDPVQAPHIVGTGIATNLGMRKGTVANIGDASAAIDQAVAEAERMAGFKIHGATININGTHVVGMNTKGVIAISSSSHEITPRELERAQEAATVVQLPANREIIHVFAKNYSLDGQDNIKNPLGMNGVRLEVDAHVITAASPAIRNLEKAVQGASVEVVDRVISSVASADVVLSRQLRENGVVLVDFGGGTTNIAVFEEGDLQHIAVIPVGSINITNDLAIGLRTDLDVAEKVKVERGSNINMKSGTRLMKVRIGSHEHKFEKSDIDDIIQARVDEVCELIDKELKKVDRSGKLPGGVVLVGGGANLAGIADYMKLRLRLPARVLSPSGFSGVVDKVRRPEFATAIGLMLHDMHASQLLGPRVAFGANLKNVGGFVARLLNKFRP